MFLLAFILFLGDVKHLCGVMQLSVNMIRNRVMLVCVAQISMATGGSDTVILSLFTPQQHTGSIRGF